MDYIILALLAVVIVLLVALLFKKGDNTNKDIGDIKGTIAEMKNDAGVEKALASQRHEQLARSVADGNDKIVNIIQQNNEKNLERQAEHQEKLSRANLEQSDRLNKTLSESIEKMQKSNEQKLDLMRKTVDEKLDETLTKRLDTSFKTVSEQLEKLYKSLGEMKDLSSGVSDLQRLLTNVKARGTWAEVQLGEILEQFLTADQFDRNVSIRKNGELVEYAVRIPSRDDPKSYHLLPIDSKFPQEDYLRLQEAANACDKERVEECCKALERTVKLEAKKISDHYIEVPATTDFAIMFLPTEGLYAEVLRRPGLCEDIQSKYRVMICGPTTISAFLSTLKVGFRTIALDKKAAEVWQILGAAKQQYEKFGDSLAKVKRKIDEAGNLIDKAQQRNGIIQKKLKGVEVIESGDAESILGLDEPSYTYTDDEEENI